LVTVKPLGFGDVQAPDCDAIHDVERQNRRSQDTVAGRLIWAREAFGLSQAEFARKAGIGQTTYSNWENGFPVGLQGALQLRKTFRLSLDWIYFGDSSGLPKAIWERITNYTPGSQPIDGRHRKVRPFRRRQSDTG
jgi:transcriptional regulator with XRE-family HTH domain